MISVVDIEKRFGRIRVLSDVSFDVPPGSISALVGPNGAGKSTILHILAGLISPDGGSVWFGDDESATSAYRRRIGFCPDDLPQPDLLTGAEFLDMVAGIRGRPRSRVAETALIEGVHLEDALPRLIQTYSHGMKRKLQIVAALLHRPDALILDEPFRGLDPESASVVKGLLRVYADRGNVVLISTHDLLVAEQMCTKVIVMQGGRVLVEESVASIRRIAEVDGLEDAFLRLTGLEQRSASASQRFFEGLDLLDETL